MICQIDFFTVSLNWERAARQGPESRQMRLPSPKIKNFQISGNLCILIDVQEDKSE